MFEPRDREAEIEWRVIPFDAEEFRALERRSIAHAGRHDNPGAHARGPW